MKITEAKNILDGFLNNTDKKCEKKLYKIFIDVLTSLEQKELTQDNILLIEEKLEQLDLGLLQDKKAKYIKRSFIDFTKFLKDKYNFIEKGYYTGLGMSLGMVVGLAVASFSGLTFGMNNETTGGLITGMIAGMIVGTIMDSNAQKENRVLTEK